MMKRYPQHWSFSKGLAKAGLRLELPTSWGDIKKLYMGLGFLGILLTAALLSLGAPFRFSTLKMPSNLRPAAVASTAKTTSVPARSN
jgi:hypothetical protein